MDFQGAGIEYLAEDIERAKAEGHDGFVALDYDDGGCANHYMAFHACQIKSVTGNSGLFDRECSDMSDRQISVVEFERSSDQRMRS